MPAIASLEDLKSAQKGKLLSPRYSVLMRVGWKNICKLWLQERSPEQLKGGEYETREG